MTPQKRPFSSGPTGTPVTESIIQSIRDFRGTGISVLDFPHREELILDRMKAFDSLMRRIVGISDEYAIIPFSCGCSDHFNLWITNVLRVGARPRKIAYLRSGFWSDKALAEAQRLEKVGECEVSVIEHADPQFRSLPDMSYLQMRRPLDADFLYVVANETTQGVRLPYETITSNLPFHVVADFSSCFLEGPLDVSKYGIIFLGAQKGLGPAGLSIVIIRRDLIGQKDNPHVPLSKSYAVQAKEGGLYNTPNFLAIESVCLMLEWIEKHGGLTAMEAQSKERAAYVYGAIGASKRFYAPVVEAARSRTNPVFCPYELIHFEQFLSFCKERGIEFVKGHRSAGNSLRLGLFNGKPMESVYAFGKTLEEFERTA
ncbi:3-phosphoserine/phosphohydroxythreonine transaminase [Candidatus Kaiserbacteria bacterium]|nr:3-phosphoserine/phosphohydroxythreonine transaminase [Candidatus Kaiserbacteria bacterium]